jgi:predicted RNA-binding Zn ribbon-like protein
VPADAEDTPLRPSAAAALVLAFVNTRPIDGAPERLGDGALMADWLAEVGLPGSATLVTDADAAAARELREALVGVLLAHSGAETDTAAEEHLRRSGELHPVLPIVTTTDAGFRPAQPGVPGAFGRILSASAELAVRGTWLRIKACRNPPCHLGFYDRTRNASAAYCNPRRCGTQVAMRAYRARKDADR